MNLNLLQLKNCVNIPAKVIKKFSEKKIYQQENQPESKNLNINISKLEKKNVVNEVEPSRKK